MKIRNYFKLPHIKPVNILLVFLVLSQTFTLFWLNDLNDRVNWGHIELWNTSAKAVHVQDMLEEHTDASPSTTNLFLNDIAKLKKEVDSLKSKLIDLENEQNNNSSRNSLMEMEFDSFKREYESTSSQIEFCDLTGKKYNSAIGICE